MKPPALPPAKEWYFRGTRSHRRTSQVVLHAAIGCGILVSVFLSTFAVDTSSRVALLVMTLFLGWTVGRFFYHAWKRTTWEVGVGTEGVFDGAQLHSWSDVCRFSILCKWERLVPLVQLRPRWKPMNYAFLVTDRELSVEEARALMRTLREKIRPAFPEVVFFEAEYSEFGFD